MPANTPRNIPKLSRSNSGCVCCRSGDVPVFNVTTPNFRGITWKNVLEMGRKAVYKHPFEMTIWYPGGNLRNNKVVHNLCVIFFHFLPAYFVDFLLLIFGQKRL
jgi:fatty acyl-CoA reductase